MAKSIKEYLVEKGVKSLVAQEMDEITLAMQSRISRFNKQGVEKNLIMIDLGKYRHFEAKSPKSLAEMQRITLDYGIYIVTMNERFRMLEQYGILKLNFQSAEYEFTAFGKSFFDPKPA